MDEKFHGDTEITKEDGTSVTEGTLASNGVEGGSNLKAMVYVISDCSGMMAPPP